MGLFDGIKDGIKYHLSDEPEWKGKRFEDYVEKLFDQQYYSIVEKTHSYRQNEDRYVESSMNPAFTFRYKRTGDLFAVECKYRSGLNPQGMLEWSNPRQLERYRAFARERGIPVFIVIGFKGFDDDPEDLFVIPLEDAKYPTLYPSVFNKYSRNPKKPFFWQRGMLS